MGFGGLSDPVILVHDCDVPVGMNEAPCVSTLCKGCRARWPIYFCVRNHSSSKPTVDPGPTASSEATISYYCNKVGEKVNRKYGDSKKYRKRNDFRNFAVFTVGVC